MRRIIFVKHAKPLVDPAVSSERWKLSVEGEALCGPLAELLRGYSPVRVVTSNESKAVETGRIVAATLGIESVVAKALHEHDRSNVPHMRSGEFISSVANFFKQTDRLVLGRETARQACDRFERAVNGVVERHAADECLAIVTHGTVLSLLAERKAGMEPFGLWRKLGLPSFVVFELPSWKVATTVENVGSSAQK
jgi:broad specificity phosphatase PhoE